MARLHLITDADFQELRRLKRKVDTIDGRGVVNTPQNVSINPPPPSPGGGGDEGRRRPSLLIPIQITAIHAEISDYRWSYQWQELEPTANGNYQFKTGGRTHTTTGLAYNLDEWKNTSAQVGNVNLGAFDELLHEVEVFDASEELPVVSAWIAKLAGGGQEVRFWYQLRIDVTCKDE